MKTGGLPYKSHMPLELFRVGDRVSPTYGLLRGELGVVAELRSEKYGREMVVIRFDSPVRKYSNQVAKAEWSYEPENVRLEAFSLISKI
jgi:hypothetical protein